MDSRYHHCIDTSKCVLLVVHGVDQKPWLSILASHFQWPGPMSCLWITMLMQKTSNMGHVYANVSSFSVVHLHTRIHVCIYIYIHISAIYTHISTCKWYISWQNKTYLCWDVHQTFLCKKWSDPCGTPKIDRCSPLVIMHQRWFYVSSESQNKRSCLEYMLATWWFLKP